MQLLKQELTLIHLSANYPWYRCCLYLDAAEAASISPRSLAKQLNIGNTAALERRIKRELEENGRCFNDSSVHFVFSK